MSHTILLLPANDSDVIVVDKQVLDNLEATLLRDSGSRVGYLEIGVIESPDGQPPIAVHAFFKKEFNHDSGNPWLRRVGKLEKATICDAYLEVTNLDGTEIDVPEFFIERVRSLKQ